MPIDDPKKEHPLRDFVTLLFCFDGAKSREDARERMKGTFESRRAYDRAVKDPRMSQALSYAGELYSDYYGWESEVEDEPEAST